MLGHNFSITHLAMKIAMPGGFDGYDFGIIHNLVIPGELVMPGHPMIGTFERRK